MNGTVRLVNGRRASEGSVQICVNGVWGHVCGYGWHSNFNNARVVCRQLGYSTTGIETFFHAKHVILAAHSYSFLYTQCIVIVIVCFLEHLLNQLYMVEYHVLVLSKHCQLVVRMCTTTTTVLSI